MPSGSFATGATSGGPVTQIVARGTADYHLTGAATVTFWRLKHSTHTNHACEHVRQNFDSGTVAFGSSVTARLGRTGDLIHKQYVEINLPGLYPVVSAGHTTNYAYVLEELAADAGGDYMPDAELQAGLTNALGGFYCHWTNAVGFALLKRIQLIIGNHQIDQLTSEYMYAWEELSGKAGKRMADMIGRFETREQLIAYSRTPQILYVPLPFWYTQVAGNSLALVSLAFHGVQVSVQFRELEKLIIVSNRDIVVHNVPTDNGVTDGQPVTKANLNACMVTQYVYLDVAERSRFAEGLFDQLITTMQCQYQETTNTTLDLDLNFNHPMLELIMMVRLEANEMANRFFDFSRVGPSTGSGRYRSNDGKGFPTAVALLPQTEGAFDLLIEPETIGVGAGLSDGEANDAWIAAAGTSTGGPNLVSNNGMYNLSEVVTVNADPVRTINLTVNGSDRFQHDDAQFFRQVTCYEAHTHIPSNYIYTYNFALYPEEPNPSGALNFSRLDNVKLRMVFHPSLAGHNLQFFLFGRSWNVFSYVDGIGGRKYAA